MTLGNHSIRYQSIDEAIADLRQMLPVLAAGQAVAESGEGPRCPPALYDKIRRALELLRDEQALRQRLESGRRTDGSVEFRFASEVDSQ